MRSDAEIRNMIADAAAEKAQSSMLLAADDVGLRSLGHENDEKFGAVVDFLRWTLGEGLSPIHRYDQVSDALILDLYNEARAVIDNDEPLPDGVSRATMLGVYRAARWVRSTSDRFVTSPVSP